MFLIHVSMPHITFYFLTRLCTIVLFVTEKWYDLSEHMDVNGDYKSFPEEEGDGWKMKVWRKYWVSIFDLIQAQDVKLTIWIVEWVSGVAFGWTVLEIDKSTSSFRTSIVYRLLFFFALLQNQRIKTFEPFFGYLGIIFRSL